MKIYGSLIGLFLLVVAINGCTYWVDTYEKPPEKCNSGIYGVPDIPGWKIKIIPIADTFSFLRELYFIDDSKGLLFSNVGIWLTENDGKTWGKVFNSLSILVYDISFVDQFHGFVSATVDNHSCILSTKDGGHDWSTIYYYPGGRIVHLSFVDSLMGYGSFWYQSNLPNESRAFNAKTLNGGVTWEEIPTLSASNGERLTIKMSPSGFGFIPGSGGEIHLTNDFGENWSTLQTGLNRFSQNQFLDSKTGFVSDDDNLYKTVDGGMLWTIISEYHPGMFYFFSALDGISIQTVASYFDYDVTENCNAFLTTSDGGLTWIEGPASINFYLKDFNFINDKIGYGFNTSFPYTLIKFYR
ncbi:MAG: hypothetical protein WBP41_00250 [Saprospiraceae bacterium]